MYYGRTVTGSNLHQQNNLLGTLQGSNGCPSLCWNHRCMPPIHSEFCAWRHHLVTLTWKNAEWKFGLLQLLAMEDLKQALLKSPALWPIEYTSEASVILSVNTSYIAIGFILSQSDLQNTKLWYYLWFRLIILNEQEAHFSQLKLELYGLYCSLHAQKLHLIGVWNLIVEVDAKYIRGMLANPDIASLASINWWILSILMFHFTLVHVLGTHHGPDGLSRRHPQPSNKAELEDDFEDWIDNVNRFMHFIKLIYPHSEAVLDALPVTIYINEVGSNSLEVAEVEDDLYDNVPHSEEAEKVDERLDLVLKWLEMLQRPDRMLDSEYKMFMWYGMEFFISHGKLWCKDSKGQHKRVIRKDHCLLLIWAAHDDVWHHGVYATNALISKWYWWLHMAQDIAWFVLTCHICQIQKTHKILIPPIVAMLAPLFSKVYMDTMHMPPSNGYKYIVQGWCLLIHYLEWTQLKKESAKAIGLWILHDIIYRWGCLLLIVTDNGPAFVAAINWLEKHYRIKHIQISGYTVASKTAPMFVHSSKIQTLCFNEWINFWNYLCLLNYNILAI